MTDAPPPISYQPQHLCGVVSTDREGDTLRIELRPMSTWTFAGTVWPAMIWAGVSGSLVGLLIVSRSTVMLLWMIFGATVLISLASLVVACHRRSLMRMLWVSPHRIGWRDCRIGDIPRFTRYKQTLTPAWVARCWWRPWVCELKVRPVIPWSTFGRSDPIILAIDTDRKMLESLVPIIEAARVPVTENEHVRAAFEVIVKPMAETGGAP